MTPNNTIITPLQLKFLELIGSDEQMKSTFYLTGGTALTGFYIPYRFSEDLDFFSEVEFNPEATTTFLVKNKKALGYESYEFNTSFNRNLYFLSFPKSGEYLKVEFTYFPFSPYMKQQTYKGVRIDSAYDIALNKLFSIYQNPIRSRDFIDLFMLCKTYNYKIDELVTESASKFGCQIDFIKLGTSLSNASKLTERPNLIEKVNDAEWIGFFEHQTLLLKNKIIKNV